MTYNEQRTRHRRGHVATALAGVVLAACALGGQSAHALTLTESSAVVVSSDNAVIENLSITADGSAKCGIQVYGYKNVTIRNVEIKHANMGICSHEADGLSITDVKMINTEAPEKGPFCIDGVSFCGSSNLNEPNQIPHPDSKIGIKLDKTPNARIERVHTEVPSGGFFIHKSPGAELKDVVCIDMRGPRPRGHCVIFVYSDNSSLDGFYVKGYREQSHQEDNINAYHSSNVTVSNGLIDGNFSIHGVGVIADEGSDNVTVRNVDVIDYGVAAVGTWAADDHLVAKNFVVENVRAKNGHCDARYGGKPSSSGLVFTAHPMAENPQFRNVQWYNHCQDQISYCMAGASCRKRSGGLADIREEDFTPREPLELVFPWEVGSVETAPTIVDVVVE